MKLADLSEAQLVSHFRESFPRGERTIIGIGDDCAQVGAPEGSFIVTTDVMVEDQHFHLSWSTGYEVGERVAAQNLADIDAMGGRPSALVASVVAPRDMDADVFGALEAGADGFILKDCEPEELVDAVRRLASGYGLVDQSVTRRVIAEFARRQGRVENREALGVLTEREREVVQLLASGMSNAEIAAELIVETSTVKSHLTRILPKIGARDRVQAVVWAFRNGLA